MIINKIQEFYIHLFQINHFFPNKPNSIFLKTFNSEFKAIELWLTVQNSQLIEIENRINLTLVIK